MAAHRRVSNWMVPHSDGQVINAFRVWLPPTWGKQSRQIESWNLPSTLAFLLCLRNRVTFIGKIINQILASSTNTNQQPQEYFVICLKVISHFTWGTAVIFYRPAILTPVPSTHRLYRGNCVGSYSPFGSLVPVDYTVQQKKNQILFCLALNFTFFLIGGRQNLYNSLQWMNTVPARFFNFTDVQLHNKKTWWNITSQKRRFFKMADSNCVKFSG